MSGMMSDIFVAYPRLFIDSDSDRICMEDPRDDLLLGRLRKGDSGALDMVLRRYEQKILGFITSYVGNPDLAQDVAQDTFLKLIKRPPIHTYKGSLKPWLFKVARNLATDYLRRENRYADIESVGETSGDSKVSRSLENDDIQYLLSKLNEESRVVVGLRIYGGMTFEEISKQLKIPLGTALWRMREALKAMRAEIERNES